MKFPMNDFFSKYHQIRWKLRIWSHLLEKNCWKVLSIVHYHFLVSLFFITCFRNEQFYSQGYELPSKHRSAVRPKHTSKCLCYENQTCLFNFYLQFLYNANSQFWRWIKQISNSHRPSGAGGGGKTEATSTPPPPSPPKFSVDVPLFLLSVLNVLFLKDAPKNVDENQQAKSQATWNKT